MDNEQQPHNTQSPGVDEEQLTGTPSPNDSLVEELQRQPRFPIGAQLTVLVVLLLGIFSTGIIPHYFPETQLATPEQRSSESRTAAPTANEETVASFADIDITGDAAFVWDVERQRVLYEKNPDEQLPLASITKLMTALLAYEIIESDETVTITSEAIYQDGDSGFQSGERFNFKDLLDLTLMSSSNDGAFALAHAAGSLLSDDEPTATFVRAMNIRAEELGLNQTYFHNPTGLDVASDKGGAYGSARDVSFLLEHIVRSTPELLGATIKNEELIYNTSGAYHESENTNPVINQIPGIIGSKTGYTTLAGGNLTIAFDAGLNRPVIVTVLGSTRNDRFYDVLKLAETAQAVLAAQE